MRALLLAKEPEEKPAEYRKDDLDYDFARTTIGIYESLQILRQRKAIIIATFIAITVLTFVVVNSMTPRYTGSVLVEIDPRQVQVVDFDAVLTGLTHDDKTINTEIEIIKSRKIAGSVIERLALHREPEFNPALRPESLFESWRYSFTNWLSEDIETHPDESLSTLKQELAALSGFFRNTIHSLAGYFAPPADDFGTKPADYLGTENERIATEQDRVIEEFLSHLKVNPESRSRVVRISFESENPRIAFTAAGAVADFYIRSQIEAKFEATKRAIGWLNEGVLQLREEVMAKERRIEELRAKSGLLQGGANATLASEQISELNAQYILEVARSAEARARLRQVDQLIESGNDGDSRIESSVEVLQSQLIQGLRSEEALLEREIAELTENYGERHPILISARAELQDLKGKIELEINRIIQGLRNEVAIASARASSLAISLEQQKEEIARLNQSEIELRSLELDANASRTLLENLSERTKEAMSQENFQQADANVVSPALRPTRPSFPNVPLIMSIATVLAVILGVLLAFAIHHLDFGLRSGEQVSRLLGVRSLGLLPQVSRISSLAKAPHDYVLKRPNSAFCEGLRTVYANLLLSDVAERPQIIMMASALPNEGKTTVALSLARLLAAANYCVLVVDCDLRNPEINKKLGIDLGPGVVECVTNNVPLEEVIREDKASGVHVMQAGKLNRDSLELFGSKMMKELLANLKPHYNFIILDSAPILGVSDSLFLARLSDKVVFLVRWAKTRQAVAKLALKQMLAAEADVAGVVLTMVNVKSHAAYGYGDSGVYSDKFQKYYSG